MEAIRQYRAGEPVTAIELLPDEPLEPALPCVVCKGFNRVVRTHDPDAIGFARAIPCPSCEGGRALAQRAIDRLFRDEVPSHFAGMDFASYRADPRADRMACDLVETWADHGAPSWLYLWGEVGRGKTGLAIAALRRRVEAQGCGALFRTSPDLLDVIRNTFDREAGGPTTSTVVEAIKDAPLLILDDLGAESVKGWVAETLFKVLNARHDRQRPTVLTSNFRLQDLAGHLGPEHGLRIADRIVEACGAAGVIHVQGAVSLRQPREYSDDVKGA